MARLTKGSLENLPPSCRAAVRRAVDRDAREGAGDLYDLALVVARAVWRAGIARGRELERAERKPKHPTKAGPR
jgi:hypothetical protein